jgi:hypothetical protein
VCGLGAQQPDDGGGQQATPGHYTEWPQLRPLCPCWVKLDPGRRWVAAANPRGRMQVWQLTEDHALGQLLGDTQGAGFGVEQCEWAGDHLFYCGIEGIEDLEAFYGDPPRNIVEYMQEHTKLFAWDAETKRRQPVTTGYMTHTLLGSPSGDKLALFKYRGGLDLSAEVYSVPDFSLMHSFPLGLEAAYRNYVPCYWSDDERYVYALAETRAEPPQQPWQVLVRTGLDGSTQSLSNATDVRLWGRGGMSVTRPTEVLGLGVLNLSPVEGRRFMACTLAPAGAGPGPFRLGFFDATGLVADYPLDAQWDFGPRELRKGRAFMNTVTITPDGQRLILQELPSAGGTRDVWVWAWNYKTRDAQRLVQMPPIDTVFAWIGEEDLVVRAGPPEGEEYYVRTYGVLHVPPAEDEGE